MLIFLTGLLIRIDLNPDHFLLFLSLDPDPDTPLNPDPIRKRIKSGNGSNPETDPQLCFLDQEYTLEHISASKNFQRKLCQKFI
jgi:hypothetical protein